MSEKLRVIYLITDQHRWDMVGCYGNQIVQTPNIDRLAGEGIRFTHAYTPTAICGPARASLFTGMFPVAHGVRTNAEHSSRQNGALDILPGITKLPDYIPGYDYIHLGKWHAEESTVPSDYGAIGHDFDGYGFPGSRVYKNFVFEQGPEKENRYARWLQEKGFETPTVSESFFGENPRLRIQELYGKLSGPAEAAIPFFLVDDAISYLSSREAPEKPFFMSVNFWGPHTPCVIPEPYYSMYDPQSIPEDPSFAAGLTGKPTHFEHISKMWGVHDLAWSEWQKIIARYYGYITMIDAAIGRLVETLQAEGLYENTLIVFTADHGDAMGAYKLIEKGEFMHDINYRIPLIARHPQNTRPGQACDEFVYFHDLCPTLAEVATGTAPDMQGQSQSILGFMRGDEGAASNRDFVYGEFTAHFSSFPQRMLRTRTHKLIFNAASRGELYDMQNDPHEIDNKIDEPALAEVKRELINQLIKQMDKMKDPLVGWLKRIQDFY